MGLIYEWLHPLPGSRATLADRGLARDSRVSCRTEAGSVRLKDTEEVSEVNEEEEGRGLFGRCRAVAGTHVKGKPVQ